MKTINGVEIFKTGTHKGRPYTRADLQKMVDAFAALDFKPPVKLGHLFRDVNQPEPTAAGWLANVRLNNDTVLADLVDLPDPVYEAIRTRGYDNVSAEVAFNLERNGKVYPIALTALALLGINLPAVAGLKPLHTHFDFGFLKTVEAEAYSVDLPGDSEEAIYIALPHGISADKMREAVASLSTTQNEETEMTKEEIQALIDAGVKAGVAAQTAEFNAKLEAEKKAREAAERTLQERQAEFEAQQRAAQSATFAERCVVPALRPMIAALHGIAAKLPGTETFDIGTKDKDGKPARVGSVETLSTLIDTVNTMAKSKLFALEGGGKGGKDLNREGGADYDITDPKAVGDEVVKRVDAYLADAAHKGSSYDDALAAVLMADEELKNAYHAKAA